MYKDNDILNFSACLEANKKAKVNYDNYHKDKKKKEPSDYLYGPKESAHKFLLIARDVEGYASYDKVLISLDKEDLTYFVNKYIPELKKEIQKKLDAIRNEYVQSGLDIVHANYIAERIVENE